jgi:hypothetical protein
MLARHCLIIRRAGDLMRRIQLFNFLLAAAPRFTPARMRAADLEPA